MWKFTKPPNFGARGWLTEYLRNIQWSNALFEDDIRLEGVLWQPLGAAVVVSQPFIEGSQPSDAQVADWFSQQGYSRDGFNKWRAATTGAVIADAHTGNFVLMTDGILVPIDLQVLHPGRLPFEQGH